MGSSSGCAVCLCKSFRLDLRTHFFQLSLELAGTLPAARFATDQVFETRLARLPCSLMFRPLALGLVPFLSFDQQLILLQVGRNHQQRVELGRKNRERVHSHFTFRHLQCVVWTSVPGSEALRDAGFVLDRRLVGGRPGHKAGRTTRMFLFP